MLKINIIISLKIKNEKRAYGKNRYHNMSSEQLQKHKEYQKYYQKIYREKKKQELQNSKK